MCADTKRTVGLTWWRNSMKKECAFVLSSSWWRRMRDVLLKPAASKKSKILGQRTWYLYFWITRFFALEINWSVNFYNGTFYSIRTHIYTTCLPCSFWSGFFQLYHGWSKAFRRNKVSLDQYYSEILNSLCCKNSSSQAYSSFSRIQTHGGLAIAKFIMP